MKAIKRTVAALLATLMLATSTSFTLAAENLDKDEEIVIAKVQAAGVMQGTGNGFEPSMTLTRAQAAAIVVRMKGISEATIAKTSGTTNFKDVAANEWYAPYVAQALLTGIVKGVSATEFAPTKEVTIQEFVTMAVRALGAGQLVDSDVTSWPTNYINFANENKLLEDVNAIPATVANRLQAATIVANTLEATMWEKTGVKSNGEITWDKTKNPAQSILGNILKIAKYEDVKLTVINEKDRKVTAVYVKDNSAAIAKEVSDDVNLTVLNKSTEYDLWYNTETKEICGIWRAEDSKQETADFTKISSNLSSNKIKLNVNGKDVEYKLAGTFAVYYNGDQLADNDTSKLAKNDNAFGHIVLDSEGKICSIMIEQYNKVGIVKEINTKSIYFNTASAVKVATSAYTKASSLPINEENYEYSVKKDGKAIELSDIEKDDVLFYYETTSDAGNKKYVICVNTDMVSGKVSSIYDKAFVMDSEKYDTFAEVASALQTKSTIEAYRNIAGKVVIFTEVEEGNSDLAVVKSFRVTRDGYDNYRYEVVLTTLDGEDTEAMILDLDETRELSGTAVTLTGKASTLYTSDIEYKDSTSAATTDKNSVATIDYNSLVGSLVKYSVKGNKVAFSEYFAGATIVTKEADPDDQIKKLAASYYDDDTMRIYTSNINAYDYVLTKDTKVLNVKMVSDLTKEEAKYSFNVEVLNAEDLGDDTVGTFAGYVAGFNPDNKKVETLVLLPTAKVKHSVEKVYGLVSKVTPVRGDDTYKSMITFLTKDGKVEALSTKVYTDFNKGYIYDITVNGKELEDSVAVTNAVLTPASTVYTHSNESMRLGNGTTIVNFAENVLFVSVNGDGDYEIGDAGDIVVISEAAVADPTLVSGIDHTLVAYHEVANTDTLANEAIVVVYSKDPVEGVITTISTAIGAANDDNTDVTAAAALVGATSSINGKVVTYIAKDGYIFDTDSTHYSITNSTNFTGTVTSVTANKLVITYA